MKLPPQCLAEQFYRTSTKAEVNGLIDKKIVVRHK